MGPRSHYLMDNASRTMSCQGFQTRRAQNTKLVKGCQQFCLTFHMQEMDN
jgi:hypothetical protein